VNINSSAVPYVKNTESFYDLLKNILLPSVVWYCLLGKCIWPVKNEWWGTGVVICLEGDENDLHMAQLMPLPLTVSCSSKPRLVLPFWYWLTWANCYSNVSRLVPFSSYSEHLSKVAFIWHPRWSWPHFQFRIRIKLGGRVCHLYTLWKSIWQGTTQAIKK